MVDSFAVPRGFGRVEKPFAFPSMLVGLFVLMRFQRTRKRRREGVQVVEQWCEWELGRIVKQRSQPGLVDIQWPDVGRRTSKLVLNEYGGGRADGPGPTWVFCIREA